MTITRFGGGVTMSLPCRISHFDRIKGTIKEDGTHSINLGRHCASAKQPVSTGRLGCAPCKGGVF
jgi:hypothetical protein